MINKVLKVGDSAAVTIPKEVLKEMGVKIGDRVSVSYLPQRNEVVIEPLPGRTATIKTEFAKRVEDFIARYKPALDELSRR